MALSKDDCLQCIAECTMDTLPDRKRMAARMEVDLMGREFNALDLHMGFQLQANGFQDQHFACPA